MNHSPVEPRGEDFSVEERAPRRVGLLLAVVGALMIALAVLDRWPMM